jgi:hypothetical protein
VLKTEIEMMGLTQAVLVVIASTLVWMILLTDRTAQRRIMPHAASTASRSGMDG